MQNGTFINGFYEEWPIVYSEAAYGFARTGQTMLNVTDSKIIACSWTMSHSGSLARIYAITTGG